MHLRWRGFLQCGHLLLTTVHVHCNQGSYAHIHLLVWCVSGVGDIQYPAAPRCQCDSSGTRHGYTDLRHDTEHHRYHLCTVFCSCRWVAMGKHAIFLLQQYEHVRQCYHITSSAFILCPVIYSTDNGHFYNYLSLPIYLSIYTRPWCRC